jgi:hypothetical protein
LNKANFKYVFYNLLYSNENSVHKSPLAPKQKQTLIWVFKKFSSLGDDSFQTLTN